MDAETYLRTFAEGELRRCRGSASVTLPQATKRLWVVATAFARTGVLEPDVADAIVEELAIALEIRTSGEPPRSVAALTSRLHRVHPSAVFPAGPAQDALAPIAVTPIGTVLELRDGETDMDVYLTGAISTPELACLSAGVLSLPKGSLPRRTAKRQGLPPQASRVLPGWALPGVPGDLRAVDEAGRRYDLIFGGGGDGTWSTGQFRLTNRRLTPGTRPALTWLDVGNEEHSVRIDLTVRSPAAESTATANGLDPGEQVLRIRAEAMLSSGYRDIGADLPALAALVPALRAVGMLPDDSEYARLIAALCRRYAVSCDDVAGPPATLPGRWADVLTELDSPHDGDTDPPAAANLPVTFPETDGVTTVLTGLVTRGQRSALTGAFFGAVDAGYPEGPCIWLRDDGGQWHTARPGGWSSDGVNVFWARVIPAVTAAVSSLDIMIISRTADLRASVQLTWWTS